MPRIPVYDSPQVQAQSVQDGMQQLTRSTNAEALGLAGQASRIAIQAKEHADTLRAEDAFNKLQEQKTQLWGDASQKLGENGLNVHDDYLKQYDQKTQEIAGTMGAGAATKFQQAAARGRLAFSAELEHHQIQQSEALARNVVEMGHKQDIDEAGSTALPDVAIQRANHTAFLAGMEADRRGLKDDPAKGVMARQEFIKSLTSKVHMSYLAGALDRDPAGAENYLNQHQNEMLGADYHTAKEHIGVATAFSLGLSVAQEHVEPFTGDENKKDGIPEAAILGNIMQDARLQKNPRAMSQAIAVAKELISAQRTDWKEQTKRHIAAVYDVSNQKGPGAALRSREMRMLQAVDPIEADAAKNHLLGEIDAARSRANQEPVDPRTIAERGFLFNDLLDQAAHGKPDGSPLTRNDVIAQSPKLGKQLTATLVSTLGDMQRNPKKPQQYTVDHDLLASSLRKAGLIKEKMDDRARALIGDLHAKILLIQAASGQPWSPENTQKLIDAEIQPIVTDPSNHWWTSDTKAPAFKAEDAVPKAFVNEALRRNPSISRNAITQAYYLAKSKGLLNKDGSYKDAK